MREQQPPELPRVRRFPPAVGRGLSPDVAARTAGHARGTLFSSRSSAGIADPAGVEVVDRWLETRRPSLSYAGAATVSPWLRPRPGLACVVRDDASKPIRESFSGGEVNCVERAELPRRAFLRPAREIRSLTRTSSSRRSVDRPDSTALPLCWSAARSTSARAIALETRRPTTSGETVAAQPTPAPLSRASRSPTHRDMSHAQRPSSLIFEMI
jgi:hypothetical protein